MDREPVSAVVLANGRGAIHRGGAPDPGALARWRALFELPCHGPVHGTDPAVPSFAELITIAFIAAFRRHGVALDVVHRMHDDLRSALTDEYPFMLLAFKTRAPLVLDHQGIDNLSDLGIVVRHGHYGWTEPILAEFEQFDYDHDLALRWYPRGRDSSIVVDARIAFGGPTIKGAGILTHILKQRYVAGEALEETAEDFGISVDQLQEALRFEYDRDTVTPELALHLSPLACSGRS